MPRRQLTPSESFDLRQALHVATLGALMSSRRWSPGDLIFQGGTSLHLAHGSPRFSEDLDFLVKSSLKLDSIDALLQSRLESSAWHPKDLALKVSRSQDGRNPHAFVVSIGGENVIGAVRVKVEMWRASAKAVDAVRSVVTPIRLSHGLGSGMQAFVPTAEASEIYADKVFALAARPYLKPRDVFDLYWLRANSYEGDLCADSLRVRLATYPNETPSAWIEKAARRQNELLAAPRAIANDLARWLPSSWPLSQDQAAQMARLAAECLNRGISLMREIEADGFTGEEDWAPPRP